MVMKLEEADALGVASRSAHDLPPGPTDSDQIDSSPTGAQPAPTTSTRTQPTATALDNSASPGSSMGTSPDSPESRSGNAAASQSTGPLSAQRHRNRHAAAKYWLEFGYAVIPVVPDSKQPTLTWEPWLSTLSAQTLAAHWAKWPNHDVGFIVGDDHVVFDADSPASIAALNTIEAHFGITPLLVIRTSRGLHHHFRRAEGTCARSDSHSTEKHPDRIDVKTARALVVLPPSGGRSIVSTSDTAKPVQHASELTVVDQAFVDAVFAHNGKPPPRPPLRVSDPEVQACSGQIRLLRALLQHIDADCGYDRWLRVGAVIFHQTGGTEEGFTLYNEWSRTGVRKYRDVKNVRAKWKSFRIDHPHRVRLGTLVWMVKAAGYDWLEVGASAEDAFDIVDEQTRGNEL